MDKLIRRLLLNVLPAAMVVSMIYLAVFGSNGLAARHRLQLELDREARRMEQVTAENARLRREIHELHGNALTLQRAAAEELQLVPPGSTVYRFP